MENNEINEEFLDKIINILLEAPSYQISVSVIDDIKNFIKKDHNIKEKFDFIYLSVKHTSL